MILFSMDGNGKHYNVSWTDWYTTALSEHQDNLSFACNVNNTVFYVSSQPTNESMKKKYVFYDKW